MSDVFSHNGEDDWCETKSYITVSVEGVVIFLDIGGVGKHISKREAIALRDELTLKIQGVIDNEIAIIKEQNK